MTVAYLVKPEAANLSQFASGEEPERTSIFEPDPIDSAVGRNIRRLRKLREMTQSELGDRIGLAFQQVQKYERGANRVSASKLVHIARALKVSPADLLPPDEAPVTVLPMEDGHNAIDLVQACEDLAQLPAFTRDAVCRLIQDLSSHHSKVDGV